MRQGTSQDAVESSSVSVGRVLGIQSTPKSTLVPPERGVDLCCACLGKQFLILSCITSSIQRLLFFTFKWVTHEMTKKTKCMWADVCSTSQAFGNTSKKTN